ncbi:MAG: hypothetical protein COX52_03905 [Syntrophobacterales bacterium CG23_combo_of_CG06-09_8_20_14_all_48_27]|nr:MAG: hypothetical protein COX52_03905 [Syntrophobacterales bacterium CG23_combo_of_CG06-09_8_20_14_all_48_27]
MLANATKSSGALLPHSSVHSPLVLQGLLIMPIVAGTWWDIHASYRARSLHQSGYAVRVPDSVYFGVLILLLSNDSYARFRHRQSLGRTVFHTEESTAIRLTQRGPLIHGAGLQRGIGDKGYEPYPRTEPGCYH